MGELIGELVLSVVSVALGFVLGSAVLVLVRGGRWMLLRAERATQATDPDGGHWTLRIALVPTQLRFWASTRLLRMRPWDRRQREAAGEAPDAVLRTELAHPSALVEKADEAAGLVGPVMLAFAVFAVAVLLAEVVLAVVLAVVIAAGRAAWGSWSCEIVGPDGRPQHDDFRALSEARSHMTALADSIERGAEVRR